MLCRPRREAGRGPTCRKAYRPDQAYSGSNSACTGPRGNVTHINPLMWRLGTGSMKKEHSRPYRACHFEGPFTYGRFLSVSDWPLPKPLPLASYISKEIFALIPASSLLGVWSKSCNRLLFYRKEKSASRVR